MRTCACLKKWPRYAPELHALTRHMISAVVFMTFFCWFPVENGNPRQIVGAREKNGANTREHSTARRCFAKESAQAREWHQSRIVSLFTIFASLAKVRQFLMELQEHNFWILKGYCAVNCLKEFEPDGMNAFCATRFENLKTLQRMYELISAFANQKFCSFWEPISPWILHPKNQTLTNY